MTYFRLQLTSGRTYTQMMRLSAAYHNRVYIGTSIFSGYKFFVADDDATGYLRLGMVDQRCIWVTKSEG